MISRSTTLALVFACFATLSVAVAAQVIQATPAAAPRAPSAMTVIELPRVVVTGHVVRDAAP